MKILQVNKYHYPRGGADRYYLDLGQRLEKEGHEVAYFSMHHPLNLATPWSKYFVSRVSYNENIWRYAWKIPGRTLYSLAARRQFRRLLDDFKPDLVHIHNIYHQLSPSILGLAKTRKIPVVMHLHDYKLICPNHALFTKNKVCKRCLSGNYWPCVKQRCVKNSYAASFLAVVEMYLHHKILDTYRKNIDLFISPSIFMKDLLVKQDWLADKIIVINNAFRADLPGIDSPGKEDYFLYCGRLSSEKGVDLAIKALEINPNLKLKIAGSGEEENNLRFLGQEAMKTGRLQFLGWQEGKKLADLIASARAVIIPSRWLENFPLIALEALSLGTPIIAANIGGLAEIVNNNNGCLVPPENPQALASAMAEIWNEEKHWSKEIIKASAQLFYPEKNTAAVIKAYERLIK
jgi:glycosyltransferase involved in cell wall biosynthesis